MHFRMSRMTHPFTPQQMRIAPTYRVAKTHRMPYLYVIFRKRALFKLLVALAWKMTCNFRLPMGLRHLVHWCDSIKVALPFVTEWVQPTLGASTSFEEIARDNAAHCNTLHYTSTLHIWMSHVTHMNEQYTTDFNTQLIDNTQLNLITQRICNTQLIFDTQLNFNAQLNFNTQLIDNYTTTFYYTTNLLYTTNFCYTTRFQYTTNWQYTPKSQYTPKFQCTQTSRVARPGIQDFSNTLRGSSDSRNPPF